MKENFSKFKKKVWFDILITCGVAALLSAFLAVNAVLLPCKLFGIHLLWVFYVLIGLGGFALGGGIAFFFLRTDDKKIAKRMDAELNLAERVQTALVFSNQKSDMLDMQLEDAVKTVALLPATALKFKSLIATLLCGVVSVGAIVAVPVISYAVPPVYAAQGPSTDVPKDPPRQISDWEWAALDDLIKYVKSSKKADVASVDGMVTELEKLKSIILEGVSQNSFSSVVGYTASQINNVVKDANDAYPRIGEELHPQAIANSEEAAYVVNKLYEIFKLFQDVGAGNTPSSSDKPNDSDNNGDENKDGTGGKGTININDTPFFDPEKGYVMCGDVRNDYYEQVQNALAEGVISREEWENIMVTYFADLGVKDDE